MVDCKRIQSKANSHEVPKLATFKPTRSSQLYLLSCTLIMFDKIWKKNETTNITCDLYNYRLPIKYRIA